MKLRKISGFLKNYLKSVFFVFTDYRIWIIIFLWGCFDHNDVLFYILWIVSCLRLTYDIMDEHRL